MCGADCTLYVEVSDRSMWRGYKTSRYTFTHIIPVKMKSSSQSQRFIPTEVYAGFCFAACTRRSPTKARVDAVRPTWWLETYKRRLQKPTRRRPKAGCRWIRLSGGFSVSYFWQTWHKYVGEIEYHGPYLIRPEVFRIALTTIF